VALGIKGVSAMSLPFGVGRDNAAATT